jgi:hypothetical protein
MVEGLKHGIEVPFDDWPTFLDEKLKPSGPGALSVGSSVIKASTSSLVKESSGPSRLTGWIRESRSKSMWSNSDCPSHSLNDVHRTAALCSCSTAIEPSCS